MICVDDYLIEFCVQVLYVCQRFYKYNVGNNIKLVLFLFLFDKTQSERFTVGECNATKDFKNSFSFF